MHNAAPLDVPRAGWPKVARVKCQFSFNLNLLSNWCGLEPLALAQSQNLTACCGGGEGDRPRRKSLPRGERGQHWTVQAYVCPYRIIVLANRCVRCPLCRTQCGLSSRLMPPNPGSNTTDYRQTAFDRLNVEIKKTSRSAGMAFFQRHDKLNIGPRRIAPSVAIA